MRRTIFWVIMGLWAVALATLYFDVPPQPDLPGPAVPAASHDGALADDGWWGVYLQGHKVGYVHFTVHQQGTSRFFEQESVLILTTLGEKQTVRAHGAGELTDTYAIRHLNFRLTAGPTEFAVEARSQGERLRITVSPTGEQVELDGPVFLPLGLRATMLAGPLEIGRTIRGQVFDPLTRTESALELRVVARAPLPGESERFAWRINEAWRDVESVLWVDDSGQVLREDGPMGLVAVREGREEATRLEAAASSDWDAVEAVSLAITPPIDNPRQRRTLRVRLTGIPEREIPVGAGQTVDAQGVFIQRTDLKKARSYTLPYSGSDRALELASTSWLQASHPRIEALVQTILGGERDALSASRKLVQWVYRYLDKVPTASLPNALEVLDAARGDCNEHAVLLAALARAAGIPARLVGGLVYGDGAFLYHAWTDLWLGRWVPVDAALDQFPADATHVRLTEGEPEEHLVLMGMLGRLAIEVGPESEPDEAPVPES